MWTIVLIIKIDLIIFSILSLKKNWRPSVFFTILCFGLLVMSGLGFKARVYFIAFFLCCLCTIESQIHLWWPFDGQHWWDLSPGFSVPLPHSMSQDRCPTDWNMPYCFLTASPIVYLDIKIYICLTSVMRVKCGIRSTLCWKVGNISGPT